MIVYCSLLQKSLLNFDTNTTLILYAIFITQKYLYIYIDENFSQNFSYNFFRFFIRTLFKCVKKLHLFYHIFFLYV